MSSDNESIPNCPECNTNMVERLETKYYTNYLCYNPECYIIVFSS